MDPAFPLRFDELGRTASASHAEHVRDMLVQLLLVRPGERVMRPDFGAGLLHSVFAPNSPELAIALQASLHAAIDRWLADVVAVDRLVVLAEDAVLRVELDYVLLATGTSESLVLEPGAA
jgi:phage baseplate assembly protein W